MRSIKSFLRKLDMFGVSYNFRYKSREKYQTSLGGFFILLFVILVLGMGIYYFIPFIGRKNYAIVYYTMNLAATEEVSLFASESNFAVGLNCENNSKEKRIISELLDLKGRYVSYVKNRDSTYQKFPIQLNLHKCTYDDFYNKYDKNMDYLGAQNFDCVEEKDKSIQGIFSDQIFSYFEFSVVAKNTTEEFTKEIERFLFENDCKLQFVYTDIIIDLDNYKNPVTQYLNEIFIQLNPTLFIKRNIYFMNQYFSNDDYLMFVFGDEDPTEVKPLYSRYEEYALYKGMNRFQSDVYEYEYYSKIYIRADLKKTIINRKYQKFMEFYADASSLLIAIYGILEIIFNYINNFYANHSLSKLIFFFKDLEEENSFNLFKKKQKIQELLYMTDLNQSKNNSVEIDSKDSKNSKFFSMNNKDSERMHIVENNKEDMQKEIKIYNNKKNQFDSKNIKKKKINEIGSKLELEQIKINKILKSKNNNTNGTIYKNFQKYDLKEKEDDSYQKFKKTQNSNMKKGESMIYIQQKIKEDESSESQGTNMEDISSQSSEPRKKIIRAYNSFNVFEIIITEFLPCCRSQEMVIKSEALEMANNIIFKKMDVITYVRNMILFDLLNQLILDDSKKTIVNFLCRPIISLNTKQKNPFEEFYKNYREKDFKKFYQEIQDLSQIENKDEKANKLISVSNVHLQKFV